MTLRRLAGLAGLAYVAGVAIENMEVLEAPTLASPVADVRALYADQALAAVTSSAGALALLAYCLFAATLFGLLRERERPGEAWSVVALAGGIAGPVVAVSALAASAILTADGGAGLSDDVVASMFDLYLFARIVSGIFVAMFLGGVGLAALRSNTLPRWLAWFACAIAVPMSLAPIAAFTADHSLEIAVRIGFAFQTFWIFLTSLWLALGEGVGVVTFIRRCAFSLLVLAAGLIGIALVAVPGATGEFFAWGLGPEPLAAFAGGVYVGSAAAYAVALPRTDREVRGLVCGAVVLSVSVFVITLAHLDQFDFDRLQAWAWVVLFAGFSLVTAALLVFGQTEPGGAPAEPLAPWMRLVLRLAAVLLGAVAIALWIDPTGLTAASPFDLPPLGGRFAGSWVALLATLSGWAAIRNDRYEAQPAVVALVTLPAGALIAALRTLPDLEPAGPPRATSGRSSWCSPRGRCCSHRCERQTDALPNDRARLDRDAARALDWSEAALAPRSQSAVGARGEHAREVRHEEPRAELAEVHVLAEAHEAEQDRAREGDLRERPSGRGGAIVQQRDHAAGGAGSHQPGADGLACKVGEVPGPERLGQGW